MLAVAANHQWLRDQLERFLQGSKLHKAWDRVKSINPNKLCIYCYGRGLNKGLASPLKAFIGIDILVISGHS